MSYYKIKTCPDCGKLFEQKSATQVRCRDCQMAMRRAKDQQRAKERYIPKKLRTDPNKCKHKDCIYYPTGSADNTCDYIIRTGHRRGCPVWDCDKYRRRR